MFRCLYDFSYECDIQEAVIFCFFYTVVVGYFFVGIGCVLTDGRFTTDFYNLVSALNIDYDDFIYRVFQFIPFVFCGIISILIVLKKNLRNPFCLFLVFLTFFLTIVLYGFYAVFFGLFPASILMSMDDRSKKMQKELEEDIKHRRLFERQLEKKLAKERVTALIIKFTRKSDKQEEDPKNEE